MNFKGFVYKENGQTYLVSGSVAEELKRNIMMSRECYTGGKVLFPVLEDIKADEINPTKRFPALILRDGELPRVRTYWRIMEHDPKKHGHCKLLGDGLCVSNVVRYINWNDTTKKWEMEPMINAASKDQLQVLKQQK